MKICIIGGRGNFGQFFTKIFKAQKHKVFSVGRSNINKLKNIVKKSDVIILSVPTDGAILYYEKLLDLVKKNQLVIDISSGMSENKKYLAKLKCQTIFLHPLFPPSILNLKETKYVLAPIKSKNSRLQKEFISTLEKSGSKIIETSVNKHEKIMAYVQALAHFNNILLAKVIADSGITVSEIDDFSTTFFRLQFDALSRIFAQGSEIYANIQFNNSAFLNILKSYEQNFQELVTVVQKKDYLAYENIFKKIILKLSPLLKDSFAESQSLVKNLPTDSRIVGYLGPQGSYSEMAAEYLKPSSNFSLLETISDIIKQVNIGELDFGVVPIENSIQGSVVETVDGLYQNKLFIEQELVIPINHCVAALSSEIVSSKVEIVLSHPQALGQCSDYIRVNFPEAKLVATDSTSQAFKKIADESLVKAVAIGPVLAADKYKLKIIAKNIQNNRNNETKFVLITKTVNVNSDGQISSFVIVPKKDRPGLLADILKNFSDNNLNLCKIESRPSKVKLGTYIFNIDINGNFKDKKVEQAIKKIKKESDVIFLGSYDRIIFMDK